MNIKGSHFSISASMRGDDGFRAKLSKNVSYFRMKDGLFSLYLVQLHYQHHPSMRKSLTRYPWNTALPTHPPFSALVHRQSTIPNDLSIIHSLWGYSALLSTPSSLPAIMRSSDLPSDPTRMMSVPVLGYVPVPLGTSPMGAVYVAWSAGLVLVLSEGERSLLRMVVMRKRQVKRDLTMDQPDLIDSVL
jgi:hypothetical protein